MPPHPNSKSIKIISINANGIYSILDELLDFINDLNPDIIMIQETRLNNKTPPLIPNFKLINRPRDQSGGLLLYYKTNLEITEINTTHIPIENITIKTQNVAIVNLYANTNITKDILNKFLSLHNNIVIMGDYNSRHRAWNCSTSNQSGNNIYNYINQYPHIELSYPQNYTHYPFNNNLPSTIDFALIKNLKHDRVKVHNALNSDHLPITINIFLNIKISRTKPQNKKQVNWKKFRVELDKNIVLKKAFSNPIEIDEEIENLNNIILQAQKTAHRNTDTTKYNSSVINPEIKLLINKRNTLRKLLKNNYSPDLYQEYKQTRNKVTNQIKKIKLQNWQNKIENIKNPNDMWRVAKSLKRRANPTTINKLHTAQGIKFMDSDKTKAIAETLLIKHESTLNMSDRATELSINKLIKNFCKLPTVIPENENPSPSEIKKIIKNLKSKKSPGNDNISNMLVKNLTTKAIVQLFYIIKYNLIFLHFPNKWKTAIVIPIPKPNKDPLFPQNYRPISLLPTFAKIFEKIILTRLENFTEQNKLLIPEQFGFRKSHSTILQLFRITNKIVHNYNNRKTSALLLLDIENAFDSVWHEGIISRMITYNFPDYLIRITMEFLKNRNFSVKINNNFSDSITIPAGLPQGSVLSPLLFSLYVNEIPFAQHTDIAMYADDTAIISTSMQKFTANKYLEEHMNHISTFYNKWKIKINADKTKLIHFSRKRKPTKRQHIIKINDTPIAETKSLKYLGLHLDHKLKFTNHIQAIKQKFRASFKLMYSILKSKIHIKHKLNLYKNGMRPILTYACPIWSNTAYGNIKSLEVLQNKVLRVIANKLPRYSFTQLRNELKITSLKEHLEELTNKFYSAHCPKIKITRDALNTDYTNSLTRTIKLPHG